MPINVPTTAPTVITVLGPITCGHAVNASNSLCTQGLESNVPSSFKGFDRCQLAIHKLKLLNLLAVRKLL